MRAHPEMHFVVEFLPAALGCPAASYLRRPLFIYPAQVCGTEARAEIWVPIALNRMTVGPTALARMGAERWRTWVEPVESTRAPISPSLNGVRVGLGMPALAIWRQIPSRMAMALDKETKA